MSDTHPCTAHYEGGKWVHDPLNQHLAEMEAQGKLAPRDLGQLTHGVRPGYCELHTALGCTAPECQ